MGQTKKEFAGYVNEHAKTGYVRVDDSNDEMMFIYSYSVPESDGQVARLNNRILICVSGFDGENKVEKVNAKVLVSSKWKIFRGRNSKPENMAKFIVNYLNNLENRP